MLLFTIAVWVFLPRGDAPVWETRLRMPMTTQANCERVRFLMEDAFAKWAKQKRVALRLQSQCVLIGQEVRGDVPGVDAGHAPRGGLPVPGLGLGRLPRP